MVAAEDWTSSALRDGGVVAELLVRLKEAKVTPVLIANPTVAVFRWGIRQPRSRFPKKEAESAKNSRGSPNTPFSWSGGCGGSSSSPSTYIDGYEATSRRISNSFAVKSRSKVLVTSNLDFTVKRLQKKKVPKNKRMKLNTQISTQISEESCKADDKFLLPDLNIIPCE